jgi:uncharacterized damage-inducible protein DinB
MLRDYLDSQRNHVLGAIADLGETDLRRPVLPSGWSLLGLVRHLARDVERFWFAGVMAADQEVIVDATSGQPDGWHVSDDLTVDAVLADYREQVARANALVDATSLDERPAWWPVEVFGEGWGLESLREVILHVMVETACHAGHADAAREVIDGRQWLVLD